jgi:hypothetical protein
VNRREALLIRAFCGWTVFVWATRIKNLLGENHDFGFKAVHTVLALISVGFAVLVWRVVGGIRRRERVEAREE